MTKEEFIAKVTPLFIEHGFKTFTVDDMGKEFTMSKKTIYSLFNSKKEIIELSFQHVLDKFSKFFLFATNNSDNAVEAFFTLLKLNNAYFPFDKQRINIREMEYYYATLYKRKMEDAQILAKNMFYGFCTAGLEQGLIRDEFNVDAQSHLFSVLYIHLISTKYVNKNENYGKTILDNVEIMIRGVLNQEGFVAFEKAKAKSQKTDYKQLIQDHKL